MGASSLLAAPAGMRCAWAMPEGVVIRPVVCLAVERGRVEPIVVYGDRLIAAVNPWMILLDGQPDPTDEEAFAYLEEDHGEEDDEEDDLDA